MKKLTIDEMQKIALAQGGKCLSSIYENVTMKLLWECSEGHRWEASPNNIKSGTWCPICKNNKRKLSIQEMQKIAEKRGGKCLSNSYENSATNLLWECSENHQWKATPSSIKKSTWCPICKNKRISESKKKHSIEEMRLIAITRGGKCLSNNYINTDSKLLWECAKGHQWKAIPDHVRRGSWCPICAIKIRSDKTRSSIEEMQEIAESRGGKCLSKTYVNRNSKLLWQCAEGHQWEAQPNCIKSGQWCPQCSSGLGERICREFFEQLFGHQFPKIRPKWLINKRGNRMELDGYCESLGIAFEHQGEQHYSVIHFIKSEERLQIRQEDDREKKIW